MPKIIIHRKRDWILKIGYKNIDEVLLDGQKTGYLPNGETNEFEVTPGEHKLRIKSGWYRSREYTFNIFGKETKSFTVSSMRNYVTVSALLIVIAIEFSSRVLKIHLNRETCYNIIFVLATAVVGFQILGRNTYIFIRESHEN